MSTPHLTIVGGGLWGGLLACALKRWHPAVPFLLLESGDHFGGTHTWSFHESDLDKDEFDFVSPFISQSWLCYDVKFPAYSRTVQCPYHSIKSSRFHEVMIATLDRSSYRLNHEANFRETKSVIVDARGINLQITEKGYQKFVGLTLKLTKPHGLKHPLLMDAQVLQKNGFRFLYFLPWDERTVLVEDTRYADTGEIDDTLEQDLLKEVADKGWEIEEVLEREMGSLPIPLSAPQVMRTTRVVNLAGIFHDTTGYSLPDAVKFCLKIKRLGDVDEQSLSKLLEDYRRDRAPVRSFFRLMNNMLYRASTTETRYKMLQHFYTKPEELIQKFYAGELSAWDKVRIFSGVPPVPLRKAVSVFLEHAKGKEEIV